MDRLGRGFIILTILIYLVDFVTPGGKVANIANGVGYLMHFNYMTVDNRRTGALISPKMVEKAILGFQKSTGLIPTGKLDNETLIMMNKPRCGNPEGVGNGDLARRRRRRRRRRYALQGSKWGLADITYRILEYTDDLTKTQIDSELARAFRVWSDVSRLTFMPVATGPVDIEISFLKGDHGDGNPFDGPSYTLAHAFYPEYGGDTHFDLEEKWLYNGGDGVNLFQVAAHEFGHAIGLSHSDVPDSLMAPIYRGYVPDFRLHEDDIQAIQALYGKPLVTIVPRPSDRPLPSQPPAVSPTGENPCADGQVDAMFASEDGYTYAFRGRYYYYLDPANGFVFKKAMLISDGWPGLPNNIDAALGNYKEHTYFFKGKKYWKFAQRVPDENNPKLISEHWKDIPNNLDAIFKWGGNGKIYAMKGRHYWKMDGGAEYPRPLPVWKGLPYSIDAAMLWPSSGFTYFFSGANYYRFNDKIFSVDETYPKVTSQWWFDCGRVGRLVGASSDKDLGEMANIKDVWDQAEESTTIQAQTTTPFHFTCAGTATIGHVFMIVCLTILSLLKNIITLQ